MGGGTQRWNLASPERGGEPPPQAVVEGFIAPYGANRSKKRSLRSLFWNGGGEIYPFPEVLVISLLRFGILVFRRRCRASPEWDFVPHPIGALPQTPLGLCPRPRKPFFEEKGLDPKNLFSFYTVLCGFGHPH